MYLALGVVCYVFLCPSYHTPNFRHGFGRRWPTELCPDESNPENVCRPSGLEHTEMVAAVVVP
jgi:hypothetical protein